MTQIDWVLWLLAAICFLLDGLTITFKRVRFFSLAFMFIALTFIL